MSIATPRLHVTLDAGPAVHQGAGLSRYTARLAAQLLQLQPESDFDLSLFYNSHSGHSLPPSLVGAPTRTAPMGQYAWRLRALLGQILQMRLGPAGLCPPVDAQTRPLYHATEHLLPRVACPTVLTVHDLIFERYPTHHTWRNRLFLHAAMPLFVRAAHAIIAVSCQTQRDLVELYQAPAAKIQVIYEGIDAGFAPALPEETARIHAQYSPDRPYLLMVGTLEPRKNHATALRALARLRAAGLPHRLLVAGGQGWLFAPIRALVDELGLHDDVHFAGYVPGADLPGLYTGAAAVLAPSLYEGFGFPVLEAMACAAPVVCSNVSSLPEVAGDAALQVSATDDEALAAAVRRILEEPGLADDLRQRGRRQAARFRWEECAAQTLALYRAVALSPCTARQGIGPTPR